MHILTRRFRPVVFPLTLAAVFSATIAVAARGQDGYRQPPPPIADILDAAPTPGVIVGPDHEWLLLLERDALPGIVEVAAPELRLAGVRIDPTVSGRSRASYLTGLRLRAIPQNAGAGEQAERDIRTPEGALIGFPVWSADGTRIAFTVTGTDRIALWIADIATGNAREIAGLTLNATITSMPCRWAGSERLLCRTVPRGRGDKPSRPITPAGPVIQESQGRVAPNRTYQDLLSDPNDEALFEHYFTDQLVHVELNGTVKPIGEPGIHVTAEPSPDGRYVLVETVHRPFSYVVPISRFPTRIEVWNASGEVVKTIADVPLQEAVPTAFDAVPAGPRSIQWRADVPATVAWVEALDGGDPAREATVRDRVYTLRAPFESAPVTLADLGYRLDDIIWARDDLALIEEEWWKTRRTRTWVVDPSERRTEPRLLFDLSSEDRYNDPGRFITHVNDNGEPVLTMTSDGHSAYLEGGGASPEGDRPFLDRIDLGSGNTERLFRSEEPYYEEVVTLLGGEGRRAITQRESVTDPENYYLRHLASGDLTRLTNFPDPAPQFAGVTKRLLRYTRADGVELSATLYLPPGYDSTQGPLPFLLWAYPREFKSVAAASQVIGSPYRFTRPSSSSHLFAITQGYGVLDGPTMPIVGAGDDSPNDSYVPQLVASAQAAVDEIVAMGVADRNRIAIGGHSYGAFMAANLLAHSDIFRAGIARSGAYNRTLTPFGFQAEERTFWKARDIYMAMSPFTYADSINEPVLLIHGMADNNSGTFPVQSERLFAALKGNGGKARLVMLPAESHGYRARESVGHVLWEMVNWLDTYVKPETPQVSRR